MTPDVPTVRVVHDPVSSFGCLRPIDGDDENLCARPRGHKPGCLPFPTRWCRVDITAENPRFVRSAAA